MGESYIALDGWAGRTRVPCEVVGETPKRYRVRLLESARMPSRRYVTRGEIILVPKSAVGPRSSGEASDGK